ncbi:MAG: phosphoribosylformylglycinamidine synthase [Gammaproteobacteria bacterium]
MSHFLQSEADVWLAYGQTAYPEAYCQQLLTACILEQTSSVDQQQTLSENIQISCHWLYLLRDLEPPHGLPANQARKLEAILKTQPFRVPTSASGTGGIDSWSRSQHLQELWVLPRTGTITPWSSKASDILHHCHLETYQLEAWFAWRLQFTHWIDDKTQAKLTQAITARIQDPMRQQCHPAELILGQIATFCIAEQPQSTSNGISLQELLADGNTSAPVLTAETRSLIQSFEPQYLDWISRNLQQQGRHDITWAELMMLQQINSEHCRHWIFKSDWTPTGSAGATVPDKPVAPIPSLFGLIKRTSKALSGSNQQWKEGLISCYQDNAAIFRGYGENIWMPDTSGRWVQADTKLRLIAKAETHNHPTGISPWPGAATGAGGEIRDEAAAGRGGASKLGICGYMVSEPGWRQSPAVRPQLSPANAPFAGPRQILVEAPLGAAAFANEFGRPTLAGFLRTLEVEDSVLQTAHRQGVALWGYDKPIMLAGGLGNMPSGMEQKAEVPSGSALFVIGGPAMRIGMGGSSTSSAHAGQQSAAIDFASVQRENPEMQRRCQEVLNTCWRLGVKNPMNNPVRFIHDLGAGGLSNAVPELLHDSGSSADILLFKGQIPSKGQLIAQQDMTDAEIWCNESQERFLVAIAPDQRDLFLSICQRENCPWALLGTTRKEAHGQAHLHVTIQDLEQETTRSVIDLPLKTLFEYPFSPTRQLAPPAPHAAQTDPQAELQQQYQMRRSWQPDASDLSSHLVRRLAGEILAWPSVASKSFLIHIGDRTVGGLTVRDQMVGPCQIPVADCAVTASSYSGYTGEAVSLGEKAPLAILYPQASVRMATCEALLNLAAAGITDWSEVRLCANWMADTGDLQADSALYYAVQALSDFCTELGLAIPVGKDSLFMQSGAWKKLGHWIPERTSKPSAVISPPTLALTAFAPIQDIRKGLTPALTQQPDSRLVYLDLAEGKKRLGGSVWQQVSAHYLFHNTSPALRQTRPWLSQPVPDISAAHLKKALQAIAELTQTDSILAYHDISDGGLFACAFEMALAGCCGIRLYSNKTGWAEGLFAEEAGVLMQVASQNLQTVLSVCERHGLCAEVIGEPIPERRFEIAPKTTKHTVHTSNSNDHNAEVISLVMGTGEDSLDYPWPASTSNNLATGHEFTDLVQAWTLHSNQVRQARGDQQVDEEAQDYGANPQQLSPSLAPTLDPTLSVSGPATLWSNPSTQTTEAPEIVTRNRPEVAILREQGINGQAEMAAAFDRAGFTARDVCMADLVSGQYQLEQFAGLAFCGGFSYGDTLGAGNGWAQKILHLAPLKLQFQQFFADSSRFTLGVCNGCQTLNKLRSIIEGSEHWPELHDNFSGRYEARLVQVRIDPISAQASPLLSGMGDQILLVPVSHAQGRFNFAANQSLNELKRADTSGVACYYAAAETRSTLMHLNRTRTADALASPRDHECIDQLELPQAPYPLNPNGSADGIAGLYAVKGNILAMMPHPERVFRTCQLSWCPPEWRYDPEGNWREDSPWMQLFRNAATITRS